MTRSVVNRRRTAQIRRRLEAVRDGAVVGRVDYIKDVAYLLRLNDHHHDLFQRAVRELERMGWNGDEGRD